MKSPLLRHFGVSTTTLLACAGLAGAWLGLRANAMFAYYEAFLGSLELRQKSRSWDAGVANKPSI